MRRIGDEIESIQKNPMTARKREIETDREKDKEGNAIVAKMQRERKSGRFVSSQGELTWCIPGS